MSKAKSVRYMGPSVPNLRPGFYCVRKSWMNVKSQIGLFKSLDMAKNCVDHNPEYMVFDETGKQIYGESTE